jgi:hypothetical protein
LATADILNAGRALREAHPEVGAILLECTNMCPYALPLRQATGLPVFDMAGFVRWFQASLMPPAYGPGPTPPSPAA